MIFFFADTGHVSIHELLITVFLFLTAPITANFIAKAYLARNVKKDALPESGGRYGWSIYDDPPD
jgi:multicomponent K+:H+ antiporter subunit G